jgi:hypothetical protein
MQHDAVIVHPRQYRVTAEFFPIYWLRVGFRKTVSAAQVFGRETLKLSVTQKWVDVSAAVEPLRINSWWPIKPFPLIRHR